MNGETQVLVWDVESGPAAPSTQVRPRQTSRFTLRLVGPDGLVASLRPGQELWLGRHASCHLPLVHRTVSRFHACVRWDAAEDRPVITDSSSQNGTRVNGRAIVPHTPTVLRGGEELRLGESGTISVELRHGGFVAPALLDDKDEAVMFSDGGATFAGSTHGRAELHRVLLTLEARRRTVTLHVADEAVAGALTFCLGRVVSAWTADQAGLPALQALLALERATIRVDRSVEPEETTLDVSLKELLGQEGDGTRRLVRPPEGLETTEMPALTPAQLGLLDGAPAAPASPAAAVQHQATDALPPLGGTMFLLDPQEVWKG